MIVFATIRCSRLDRITHNGFEELDDAARPTCVHRLTGRWIDGHERNRVIIARRRQGPEANNGYNAPHEFK